MEKTIAIRFRHTEQEFASAFRTFMLRSSEYVTRMSVVALLSALGIFLLFGLLDIPVLFAVFTMLLVVAGVLGTWLIEFPKKVFRADPRFLDEYYLEFSEQGILFKTEHIDAKVDWGLYSHVIETDRFFLLVYGKYQFSVAPKRAFTSEAQLHAFRDLVHRMIKPSKESRLLGKKRDEDPTPKYVPPRTPPDWR